MKVHLDIPIEMSLDSAKVLCRTMSEVAIVLSGRPESIALCLRSPVSREALAKAIGALQAYANQCSGDEAGGSEQTEYQRGLADGLKVRDELAQASLDALLEEHARALEEARRGERAPT